MDPKKQELGLYWKDDDGKLLGSIGALKSYLERKKVKLLFACNAGMYMENQSPLGLFIKENKQLRALNTSSGKGNFHMKPNGVFYLDDLQQAGICKTEDYSRQKNIRYASQSGPMLVIDGAIHSSFTKGSENLNIRNGVGILPDNKVVFAMSKNPINFYDFALYFKNLGCKNALYFDGFVSRSYLPEKNWIQTDGNFGVMVGVTPKF
ncbi:hypothetical protein CNR22_23840 [Sphingobacteriaceae bacterium]|nr:hypothetical protein CNR22_23840 [Sphingobacteriaceae bacterium]